MFGTGRLAKKSFQLGTLETTLAASPQAAPGEES
jgi:hypothetical protein